ncbi:MAG: IS66 family insertion sequence element accessory protein TnpB [Nitrospiraceae bacterium]
MFQFDESLRVFLHRDPVDFRMGINSLSILVEQAMHMSPMDLSLYVFGNRRRIGSHSDGAKTILAAAKAPRRTASSGLNIGTGVKPPVGGATHWLLEGIDLAAVRRHRRRDYARELEHVWCMLV